MLKNTIYKDKITTMKWEEDGRKWEEYDISKLDGSITKYFNRITEIKPGVTAEDFILLLQQHESVIDYCFSDYMRGHQLKVFIDDMNLPETETDFGEVELCWEGEIINNDLAIIGYLRAWLKDEKIKELGEEYEVPHDISFSPINVWKKCNLVLNENIIINNLGELDDLKKEMVFAGFYRWTLFEVISHFLEEISINGSPVERDNLNLLMENKKYDLNEILKSQEQTNFWLAFLTAELDDFNYLMDVALESEDYEGASKLKLDIEKTEKELFILKEEIKKQNGEV